MSNKWKSQLAKAADADWNSRTDNCIGSVSFVGHTQPRRMNAKKSLSFVGGVIFTIPSHTDAITSSNWVSLISTAIYPLPFTGLYGSLLGHFFYVVWLGF